MHSNIIIATLLSTFFTACCQFGSLLKMYASLSFVLVLFVTGVRVRVQLMTFSLILTMLVFLRLPRRELLRSNMSRVTA